MTRVAYSVAEVAEALGKTTVQVQRWLLSGKIPGTKVGGSWFVPAAWIDGMYDASRAEPQRGEPVPASTGSSLGGGGDDARRAPALEVGGVEERGAARPPRTASSAGRATTRGAGEPAAWSVPREVVR